MYLLDGMQGVMRQYKLRKGVAMRKGTLELLNIAKNYKDTIALKNINLVLSPGIYGLIGPNGAGKTTLMNIICGVVPSTSGIIKFNGTELNTLGKEYRSEIGYLPQNFGFDPSFTVKSYLEYIAALKGLSKAESDSRINVLVKKNGLQDYLHKQIRALSGGTKQRVGISQALLNNPYMLVLDEPTAGLDPGERMAFRQMILHFAQDNIVLLSTHIISDIESIPIKENLILKKGEIIAQGSNNNLIAPLSGKIWQVVCSVKNSPAFSKNCIILDNILIDDNSMQIRFFSENNEDGAIAVSPNLDDYYQLTFKDVIAERGGINA